MKNKTTIDKAQDALLSEKQNDILIGLLLGDAHLRTQNKGKTANLMYSQGGSGVIGEAHMKYLFTVYDIFKDWCTSPPKEILRKSSFKGAENKTYKSHKFQSVSHASFSYLWESFYELSPKCFKNSSLQCEQLLSEEHGKKALKVPLLEIDSFQKDEIKKDIFPSQVTGGVIEDATSGDHHMFYRKTVPSNIGDLLSKRGLTFWYMDDGSIKDRHSGACLLNTQSFTLNECILLCNALQTNFGLDAQIRYKSKLHNLFGHQIYISTKSARILSCFTNDFIEEMRYKLPKQTAPSVKRIISQ